MEELPNEANMAATKRVLGFRAQPPPPPPDDGEDPDAFIEALKAYHADQSTKWGSVMALQIIVSEIMLYLGRLSVGTEGFDHMIEILNKVDEALEHMDQSLESYPHTREGAKFVTSIARDLLKQAK